MAESPSRQAQSLAESQELDRKISEETDDLRAQIDAKNKEIASKTKHLNKLVQENQSLQAKLDLVTNPATVYKLIIDQGGGSFSAYLFGEVEGDPKSSLQLEKYKSVKLNALTDAQLNEETAAALGTTMHAEDGTLNDYSFAAPEHYAVITKWFAAFYKNLVEKIRESYGELALRTIRQTGKIRAVLMAPGNEDKRKVWYDAFNANLGPEAWDYALLSNEDEARIEGQAFYFFNTKYFTELNIGFEPKDFVGVGIGSSSTQAYAAKADGTVAVGFDSTAGAKATKAQAEAGEAGNWVAVETFAETFRAILQSIMTVDDAKKVIVATNAIGFLCCALTHESYPDWPGKAEFRELVSAGLPVDASKYQAILKTHVDTVPATWAGNFLTGFINACCSFPNTALIQLEQKKHHGKGLPVETSWVMYLAQTSDGGV